MARKILLILTILCLCAGSGFSLSSKSGKKSGQTLKFTPPQFSLSAGGGGLFDLAFSSYKGKEISEYYKLSDMDGVYAGGGFFAFFDATYVEADLGMSFGQLKISPEGDDLKLNLVYFDLGILGKYPISLTEKLVVFPMLGLGGHIAVSAKDDESGESIRKYYGDDGDPGAASSLWIKAGGGLDFFFTDVIFFRGELLLGYQVASTYESSDDYWVGMGWDATGAFAPTFKIAVGYKFF